MIGLGTSGPNVIEHFHGVKFEKPFTRMREYVEIINRLMREEKLDYQGDIYHLARGFTLRFETVRPHIPIFIASITPKSVQPDRGHRRRLAADLPAARALEGAARAFHGAVREGRPQAGRRGRALPVHGHRHRRPERAAAGMRRANAAFYIARMGNFYYEHFVRMGYADAADAVRKAWAEGGSAAGAAALPDALVDRARLRGRRSKRAARRSTPRTRRASRCCRSRSWSATPTSAPQIYRKLVG